MIFLWVLAALLILFCLLLSMPVEISFQAEKRESFSGTMGLRLFFGTVRWSRPFSRHSKTEKGRRREVVKFGEPSGRRKGKSPGTRGGPMAAAALRTPGFLRRIFGLLGTLRRRVRLRELEMALRGGLPDPGDTGRLYGAFAAASPLLPGRVSYVPDWEEDTLGGKAAVAISFVPLSLLVTVGGFAAHPVTVKALRNAMKVRRH